MNEPERIFKEVNDITTLTKEIINRPESGYLECKELHDKANLNDKGRNAEIFGKALSGFANHEGGILVWGVKEIKDSKGEFDHRELKPFMGVRKLEEELNLLAGEWVVPAVEGFRTKPIFSDESKDQGLILTLIPKSDLVPHMNKREHSYYRRSGSSFRVMEHSEIEDMFGRRPKPKFECRAEVNINQANTSEYIISIYLNNVGKGSAHYPCIKIKHFNGKVLRNNDNKQRMQINGNEILFYNDFNMVIHPRMKERLACFVFTNNKTITRFDIYAYCDNMPEVHFIRFLLIPSNDTNSYPLRNRVRGPIFISNNKSELDSNIDPDYLYKENNKEYFFNENFQ